ncbi:D-isomer specific 2-hydroxyacid dehydrogenase [Dactylonectria macrodidyma]|uniref:D-isomer specific 2-hydroxyacid dehydrogenase n=1 Tax=Dactylonectria macrodidyma TaxID=307937 RepID=A0A9P9IIK7_9HYPO|nr:D-isomer specific 2-hydroxyacid dehydrogenase [Dactylonectria macrodidyma]
MPSLPKALVIGSPQGLVSDAAWAAFSSRFDVRMYDFTTTESFHQSMQGDGGCHDISTIVRLGLNIPPGIEKIGQGWTKRALPHLPPSLRLIVNFGHGYDEEDVPALKARGIEFANTTGGSESTATVGLFLIIASLRQLSKYERMVRDDQFLPALRDSAKTAIDPFGKKLGIIGMGSIGQTVAKQAAVLGMEIYCVDRPNLRKIIDSVGTTGLPPLVLCSNLEQLVANVDCLILTCSYSPETHHLLSQELFTKMRSGIRIVNIARGKCIDEEALCDAVENGIVGGIGLDVHYDEPKVNPRLLKYECVTLLPHVGGLTHDSMSKHAQLALQAAEDFF